MSAQLLSRSPVDGAERRSPGRDAARPFLSTLHAGSRDRKLAMGVVLVSGLVFLALAPLAKTLLPAVPPFLPLYQSALVLTDLLTALLLFGQYAILGSAGLLVLAGAYLFSAGMAIAHALSFPGLFAPSGLFGAGPQTTAWLYFLWHGLFPVAVIAYAVLPERGTQKARAQAFGRIGVSVLCVLALVVGLYALVAAENDVLPALMQGNRDAPTKVVVATATWMLSLVAIGVLWRWRRPLSVLDLWLIVVLWVWVFDIALAAVLNAGRFDIGWYGGRVYGLLASTFVLVVLLFEYTKLYAQVVAARQAEQRVSRASLAEKNERLRLLHEIDRAIVAGAEPEAIAAAALPPLRELLRVPRVNLNLVDRAAGEGEWLAAAGRKRTHVGGGVRFPLHMLGDLDALARGEPQTIDVGRLPESPQREAMLASGVRHYMALPMIVGGELIGALSFGGETAAFPADKVTMATETATQLGIAIHQARLLERLARKAERLRIVHEIDRAIISEVEPAAIASAALRPLRDLLGVPRVVVNLFDHAAGEVEWLAAVGRHQVRTGPGVRYPLSFMGEVEALKRGELQMIETAALPDIPARQALIESGVLHYLVVPMVAGGELIGAVSFGGEAADFPPEHVTIAQEVAAQIAIAISQARLLESVKAQAQQLEGKVRERTAELEATSRQLQDLYDHAPCGYHSVDPAGRLVRMNATWLSWLGYRHDEVVGKLRHAEIMTPESAERYEKQWFPQFLERGSLMEAEVEYVRKDGTRLPALLSGSWIYDEQGKPVMSRATVTDITEHKRVHAQMHELNLKLQAANKELESFSYSVSHDLRAPLRAVDGYALMLEEDYGAKLDDEGRRLLGVVREGAAQMGRLIDDLLNFSQVGRKPIARDSVNMEALVREVVALVRPDTKARIEIGELPPVEGDRALLKQVWTNLVSNALKYSSKSAQPLVQIGARREGGEQIYWARDNGSGFDMRYYDKLFGVFQRLHRADEFEGTGVGLAIVQRVVTRHGGRVWAEGKVGEGACFFFALPVEAGK